MVAAKQHPMISTGL